MSLLIRSFPLEGSELSPESLPCPSFAWMSGDFSLEGYGRAWAMDPGVGYGRFRRADEAWRRWWGMATIDDQVETIGSGPVGFASFTFDPGSRGSVVAVPEVIVGRMGRKGWVTTVGEVDLSALEPCAHHFRRPDRPRYRGATHPDWEWMESVARALEMIEGGHLLKVVLARDVEVWSKESFDIRRLLQRLHAAFPECFTFLVEGLAGASPELLLRMSERMVESVALAGTAPRHPDPDRDSRLARELLGSEKNRLEHQLTVRSVEQSLGRACTRLDHNAEPTIRELANLRHLATTFRGVLDEPSTCFDVLDHLHPTAAVGGVPRDSALGAIRALERIDRAGYGGPVGWFDHSGDGEWAIALRCALLRGNEARLFAGAGIVAGSLPEEELAETRLKLRAMTSALDLR